jgi:oxygen-independent coproporphyrinogen III oxidase
MAGLYLHIPFCRKACHYCNFHFSTSTKAMPEMVSAIITELEMEKDYLSEAHIETVYFGGGTPSLLDDRSLDAIFEAIHRHYHVVEAPEVTLEANPDDLTKTKIKTLRGTPINRLSIGIQTFQDSSLSALNRTHNATEAKQSVTWALEAGFTALSLDLMYGIPGHSLATWQSDVEQIMQWHPEHISCYALTLEEKTALYKQVQNGQHIMPPDQSVTEQFDLLLDITNAHGYEHYEISNFSLPGKAARHNSNYWSGASYLGIGPSAHSHRPGQRRWNVANNAKYMAGIKHHQPEQSTEILTPNQIYNEYIMTRLRTAKGINKSDVIAFGTEFCDMFDLATLKNLRSGLLEMQENRQIRLTRAGKMLSDAVIVDFFCV